MAAELEQNQPVEEHDGASAATVQTEIPAQQTEAAPTDQPTRRKMTDIIEELMPDFKPMTKDEIEAEKKKEKRDRQMSTIGDGIMALSNLFFATKGAPNMFDPSKSMSAATKARWDKLKADRASRNQAFVNAYINAAKMDDDAAERDKQFDYRKARDQKEDSYRDSAEKRANELHTLQVQLTNGQITRQEYENEVARLTAEATPELLSLQKEQAKANVASTKASTVESYANAAHTRAATEAAEGEYVFNGKKYRDKDAHRNAVELAYRRAFPDEETHKLTKQVPDGYGHKTIPKSTGELMAEIEAKDSAPTSKSEPKPPQKPNEPVRKNYITPEGKIGW